jgi:hypothetical protein
MRKIYGSVVLAGILAAVLSGCASSPAVVQAPVGPDPFATAQPGSKGALKVFTATTEENNVGTEYPYYERTSYDIYDSNGKLIRRVRDNNKGEFVARPRTEWLAPGTYRVKALAAIGTGEWMDVPVVVARGRTTEVHLNGHWAPPSDTPGSALVYSPAGFPLGWRASNLPAS